MDDQQAGGKERVRLADTGATTDGGRLKTATLSKSGGRGWGIRRLFGWAGDGEE